MAIRRMHRVRNSRSAAVVAAARRNIRKAQVTRWLGARGERKGRR